MTPAPGIPETTDALELAIAKVQPDTSIDDVAQTLDRLAAYMERGRQLKEQLDERMLEYLEANGGEVSIGTVKYWIGFPKTTKCLDVRAAVEALLEATGGDMDAFCACLSSNALKYGACKEPLGDKWGLHFVVELKPKIENDKPKKDLQRMDTKFVR
jgi:hypothetical protein